MCIDIVEIWFGIANGQILWYESGGILSFKVFVLFLYHHFRQIILSLVLHFDLVFFSPFSIAIILLGEESAGLCAFCAFICFVCVGLCLFPLPLGVRDLLRLGDCGFPWTVLFTFFFYVQQA